MKILTWNINSVRLRAPLMAPLVQRHNPDVICLQETKCEDGLFPFEVFFAAGYDHIHINGQKAYNGVAIISRIPFKDALSHTRAELNDARHASVLFPHFTLHNIYVPAGGDIPDPLANPKFDHKLRFVDDLAGYFGKLKTPQMVVGDFNIAPLEHDVWSHKQLLDVVSHTPIEVEKLTGFYTAGRFVDAIRHFVPDNEKCYTWWSYRNQDWRKSNRGRRLDHIWVTEDLKPRLKTYSIDADFRDSEKPSDHVPVMVELS